MQRRQRLLTEASNDLTDFFSSYFLFTSVSGNQRIYQITSLTERKRCRSSRVVISGLIDRLFITAPLGSFVCLKVY